MLNIRKQAVKSSKKCESHIGSVTCEVVGALVVKTVSKTKKRIKEIGTRTLQRSYPFSDTARSERRKGLGAQVAREYGEAGGQHRERPSSS